MRSICSMMRYWNERVAISNVYKCEFRMHTPMSHVCMQKTFVADCPRSRASAKKGHNIPAPPHPTPPRRSQKASANERHCPRPPKQPRKDPCACAACYFPLDEMVWNVIAPPHPTPPRRSQKASANERHCPRPSKQPRKDPCACAACYFPLDEMVWNVIAPPQPHPTHPFH